MRNLRTWLSLGLAAALAGCGGGGATGSSGGSALSNTFRAMTATATTSGSTGAVSGTVTDTSGSAIGGAAVTVTGGPVSRAAGTASFSTITDASGSYAVGNMPPGHYHLTASGQGFTDTLADVVVTAGTVAAPGALHMPHGAGGGGGDFQHPTGDGTLGLVVGVVTDAAGAPVAGAEVTADGAKSSRTNPAGQFAIGNLSVGDHTIVVTAHNYQDATQTATVAAGVVTQLTFALTAGSGTANTNDGTITGTVTDSSTKAVLAGAAVQFREAKATSGADGKFTLTGVRQGVGVLTVTLSGYRDFGLMLVIAAKSATDVPVPLVAKTIDSVANGAVTVTVTDSATTKAVANAQVVLDGHRPFLTDATGTVSLTNVPVGTYHLVVGAPGYARQWIVISVTAGNTTTQAVALVAAAPPTGGQGGPGMGMGMDDSNPRPMRPDHKPFDD